MTADQLRLILRGVPFMSSFEVQSLLLWVSGYPGGSPDDGVFLADSWKQHVAVRTGRRVVVTADDVDEEIIVSGTLLSVSARGEARVQDETGRVHQVGPLVFIEQPASDV